MSADVNGMIMNHFVSDASYIGSYNMRNMLRKDEYVQYLDIHHNGIILVATSESQIYVFKYFIFFIISSKELTNYFDVKKYNQKIEYIQFLNNYSSNFVYPILMYSS